MIKKKIYTFNIYPQSVDFKLNISISSLTDLLMNVARAHADENDFGMQYLHTRNYSWVLLRFAVEMHTLPRQYETIHIETWIEEISKLSTTRNFVIRNNENDIIGYGITNWVMIDQTNRRPVDLSHLGNMSDFATGEKVPIDKPIKIPGAQGIKTDTIRARYSHIDFNQHVNTMRYLEWISNVFPLEHYINNSLRRFEINFMSELVFDDEVEIYKQEINANTYLIELKNQGQPACRAKICWNNTL